MKKDFAAMSRTHNTHRHALLIRACARSFMSMLSSTYHITVCASTGKMFITDNGTYTVSCLMSELVYTSTKIES